MFSVVKRLNQAVMDLRRVSVEGLMASCPLVLLAPFLRLYKAKSCLRLPRGSKRHVGIRDPGGVVEKLKGYRPGGVKSDWWVRCAGLERFTEERMTQADPDR